jgi:hypothetical protein
MLVVHQLNPDMGIVNFEVSVQHYVQNLHFSASQLLYSSHSLNPTVAELVHPKLLSDIRLKRRLTVGLGPSCWR